jgi:hypothetical protein
VIQLQEDSAQWVRHHLEEHRGRLEREARAAMARGRRNCLAARGENYLAEALEQAAAVLKHAHAGVNKPQEESAT